MSEPTSGKGRVGVYYIMYTIELSFISFFITSKRTSDCNLSACFTFSFTSLSSSSPSLKHPILPFPLPLPHPTPPQPSPDFFILDHF